MAATVELALTVVIEKVLKQRVSSCVVDKCLFTSSISPHSQQEKQSGCQHSSAPALSANTATSPGSILPPHPAQAQAEAGWRPEASLSLYFPLWVTIGSSCMGGGITGAGSSSSSLSWPTRP